MSRTWLPLSLCFLLLTAAAQAQALPPGDKEPFLRLEAGGPTTFVTSLAFSPDGKTLYAAGYDKVVRVWKHNQRSAAFELDRMAYRVPIAPGLDGAINAIAVSPDGTWLAVGGYGIIRGGAGFRQPGLMLSVDTGMTSARWQDRGMIYVFNTRDGTVRHLRGHHGPIQALAFAPARQGKPTLLVSAARERDTAHKTDVGGLRLWDLSQPDDKALDGREGLKIDLDTRPGLAVWHTGDKLQQMRVAVAWGTGKVYLWDAEEETGVWSQDDGQRNDTAVYSAPLDRLLTASYRTGSRGLFRAWQVPSGQGMATDPDLAAEFRGPNGEAYVPRSLALLSSRPGGELDMAAIVFREETSKDGQENEYHLHLVDVGQAGFGRVLARKVLWRGGPSVPALAASPGGRYLAVAGNDMHDILVYPIADLLKRGTEVQRIHSVGATIRDLAFVQDKNNDLGLWLTETPRGVTGSKSRRPDPDDLVFHFAKRTLLNGGDDWTLARPRLAGWRVNWAITETEKNSPVRWRLIVLDAGVEKSRIDLKAKWVSALALLPPMKPLGTPLLAVAWLDINDQPWLYLYNAATGEWIRQFTGHTDRISALAFSPDGRLLASASADQTVSVWSLTDLVNFLGKRGMLLGVEVKLVKGGLEVVHLDTAAAARRQLRLGDVIEAWGAGDKLRPADTPFNFYDGITLLKPGSDLTLQLRNRGRVAVRLGHAVNEWKPLFSLFITRGGRAQPREWVGWNPHGHYDASAPRTERLIGWHFNTGDPKTPTRFALANQYHNDYYRERILKHLVNAGTLTGALRSWAAEDRQRPLPRPKMNVWSDPPRIDPSKLDTELVGPDPRRVDANGETLVREPQATLAVMIDDFPLGKIDSVQWQVDGGPLRPFDRALDRKYTADLSKPKLPWNRGDRYRIRVVLRTQEAQPQVYTRDLILRYQAPAPKIMGLKPARQGKPVEQAAFRIQAEVRPAPGLEAADLVIEVRQTNQGKDVLPVGQRQATPKIDRELKLLPGENVIEVVARNKGALAGYEDLETARAALVVTYHPKQEKKPPPPQITLQSLIPTSGKAVSLDANAAASVVIHVPRARLEGRIQADAKTKEKLAAAGWGPAGVKQVKPLAGFVADRDRETTFSQDLTLEPGPQTLRVVARTTTSAEAERRLTIEYRPLLPTLELTDPAQGQVFYDEGKGPPGVELKGRLVLPDDARPFEVEVLLNGKKVRHTVDDEHVLHAKLALQPLENHVRVRLSNRWKMTALAGDLRVRYLRPPRIVKLDPPRTGDKALTELVALVESPLPLTAASVTAEVNGNSLPPDRMQVHKRGDRWEVRLRDVPMRAGDNEARLVVRNDEAECREPGVWRFNWQPPRPPAPPVVEILDPAKNMTVTDREVTVRFRVKSATPLRRVELVREGRVPLRKRFDLSKEKPDAQGYYVLKTPVTLVPRENILRVEAVNDGGARDSSVVVNYLHRPVWLAIDRLVLPGGKRIVPQVLPDGKLSLDAVPNAQVQVEGRVQWDRENDDLLKKTNVVRLHVNGFQQVPAELLPATGNSRERAFRAERVLLNHTDNYVELTIPGLPQEASNRSDFHVTCERPQHGQRIHFLIVGVGVKDEQKLTDEGLAALRAKLNRDGQYTAPAFEQVRLYGPLTDYVSAEQVYTQLCLIQKTIDVLASQGSANDVVWVYYKGSESIGKEGHYFLTSVSHYDKDLQRSAVSCEGLAGFFSDTLGAQLLSLDVNEAPSRERLASGEAPDRVVKGPFSSYIGLVRYRELKGPKDQPLLLDDLKDMMSRVNTWGGVVRLVRDRQSKADRNALVVYLNSPEPLDGLTIGQ
jgi:WD40 repeat protein